MKIHLSVIAISLALVAVAVTRPPSAHTTFEGGRPACQEYPNLDWDVDMEQDGNHWDFTYYFYAEVADTSCTTEDVVENLHGEGKTDPPNVSNDCDDDGPAQWLACDTYTSLPVSACPSPPFDWIPWSTEVSVDFEGQNYWEPDWEYVRCSAPE